VILADAVVRLGVQEIARLGMREDAMVEIAAFVRRFWWRANPARRSGVTWPSS
jgi:glycine/serine hydroxymethyltransferase